MILIEDNLEITLFIIDILKEYQVKHFSNPIQSFASLKNSGLIILDYNLPDMDGIEYLKFLRENHPEIPVIMITGYGNEQVCVNAFRMGIRDYLKKPFSPSELRSLVKTHFRGEIAEVTDDEISPAILNKIFLAKFYIDDNICNKIEFNEVLKIACMSRTTFNRYFKTIIGLTFKDYIHQKKIEKAKELLRNGLTVTEASCSLGFHYVQHFTKLFKKIEGISPSKFNS